MLYKKFGFLEVSVKKDIRFANANLTPFPILIFLNILRHAGNLIPRRAFLIAYLSLTNKIFVSDKRGVPTPEWIKVILKFYKIVEKNKRG